MSAIICAMESNPPCKNKATEWIIPASAPGDNRIVAFCKQHSWPSRSPTSSYWKTLPIDSYEAIEFILSGGEVIDGRDH